MGRGRRIKIWKADGRWERIREGKWNIRRAGNERNNAGRE